MLHLPFRRGFFDRQSLDLGRELELVSIEGLDEVEEFFYVGGVILLFLLCLGKADLFGHAMKNVVICKHRVSLWRGNDKV